MDFWRNKKILVTGAGGFVGSNLIYKLCDLDSEIFAIVSENTRQNDLMSKFGVFFNRINFLYKDLTLKNSLLNIKFIPDYVFHFAALDGGSSFKKSHAAKIFHDNTQMNLNILEYSKKSHVKKIFLMSSIEVYSQGDKVPFSEKSNIFESIEEIESGYSWSKKFMEVAGRFYMKEYSLTPVIVRAGNIYGPQDQTDTGRIIPTFIKKALDNQDIQISGNGFQKRSFMHVSDFIENIVNLFQEYDSNSPVNVASSSVYSLKELAEIIVRLTNSKSKIKIIESDKVYEDRYSDISRLKNLINFRESYSLEDGLRNTIESMRGK